MCYTSFIRSFETTNNATCNNVDIASEVNERPSLSEKIQPLPYTPVTAEISLKDQPMVNKEEVSLQLKMYACGYKIFVFTTNYCMYLVI